MSSFQQRSPTVQSSPMDSDRDRWAAFFTAVVMFVFFLLLVSAFQQPRAEDPRLGASPGVSSGVVRP